MKTLRDLLTDKCIEKGWDFSEESLEETLRNNFPIVWKGDEDSHRWRIEYSVVCKILDDGVERFFCYSSCKGTNDNSWEDAGYNFEGIDKVYEVYPKIVETITYVREL